MRKRIATCIAVAAMLATPAAFAETAGDAHSKAASGATAAAKPKSSTFLEAIPAVPEPSVAWFLGLGFLGLVVLRRMRSGPI